MSKFITLTLMGGKAIRVNSDRLYTYERIPETAAGPNARGEHTTVCIGAGEGEFFRVTETPEQIDALLGVAADPVGDAAHELLSALKMAREWMGDWVGGKGCLDVIDAAISRATGKEGA